MQATSEFSEEEKNLILQLDEIHVKSNVDFKGGKIFGYSLQPNHPIKTVSTLPGPEYLNDSNLMQTHSSSNCVLKAI